MNLTIKAEFGSDTISILDKPLTGWYGEIASTLFPDPVTAEATSEVAVTKNEDGSTTFTEQVTLTEDLKLFPASHTFVVGEEKVTGIEAEVLTALASFASQKTGTLTLAIA